MMSCWVNPPTPKMGCPLSVALISENFQSRQNVFLAVAGACVCGRATVWALWIRRIDACSQYLIRYEALPRLRCLIAAVGVYHEHFRDRGPAPIRLFLRRKYYGLRHRRSCGRTRRGAA